MQTINGVEFTAERPSAGAHSKKSQQNTPPGTDVNPITRLGINGFQMQLNVVEDHLDRYDTLVAEFMKQQELILVLRDGWEYHVEALGVQFPDMVIELGEKYRFTVPLISETPYQFSVDEVTVSKTISSNNETWSAGDDGTILATTGTVDAVPDITVVGGAVSASYNRIINTVTELDTSTYSSDSSSYGTAKKTYTLIALPKHKYNISLVGLDLFAQSALIDTYAKITYQFGAGAETTIIEWTRTAAGWEVHSLAVDLTSDVDEEVLIKFYTRTEVPNPAYTASIRNLDLVYTEIKLGVCTDAQVYNTADTATVMDVGNDILPDAIHTIYADGSGVVSYSDDFSTTKYLDANYHVFSETHDAGNDELDIADDGYIEYKLDSKYPITGIPTLVTQIDITAGTPTIQISTDGMTWYDIDTAIVDDVSTSYELDNATSLSFDGDTVVYFRVDCTGAGTVTCIIKNFSCVIQIVTSDVENPIIDIGAANTFQCDQADTSSMNCTVETIFNHRKWAA